MTKMKATPACRSLGAGSDLYSHQSIVRGSIQYCIWPHLPAEASAQAAYCIWPHLPAPTFRRGITRMIAYGNQSVQI